MIISGASHTGKTMLAQKMLEKYNYPYLSIDHLKMGLIRSGRTNLTPLSSSLLLTEYLWPIVREMIKTVIENDQNLIVEGCYIPDDWSHDFTSEYLDKIQHYCLIMSEKYIRTHFDDIQKYAKAIENRGEDDGYTMEMLISENNKVLEAFQNTKSKLFLIDDEYWLNTFQLYE